MSRRATHLLHPENIREEQSRTSENIRTVKRISEKNSQEHQRRTVKNIREEQSEQSKEHQRRTVKNTVRTSKLSPVETKRS